MADVLDQSDVEAVFSAVEATAARQPLSPDMPAPAPSKRQEIRAYDFKRPEQASKDQMRTLEAIHEGFARDFRASLSGFLRTNVEARVASIEQLAYSEFIHSLPNPTCVSLLSAAPLEGQLCLEISPLILYPIIDRLLGGSDVEAFVPQRPLTVIEWRLVKRITERALADLSEGWSELVQVQFELAETESNPHLVQIAGPNEVVVVVRLELRMGARVGAMNLCLPLNLIEPVMGKRATQSWLAHPRRASTQQQRDCIGQHLRLGEANLRAFLAETTFTVDDLLQLQVGDIIPTSKPASAELVLQVEDRSKFAGRLYMHKGQRALRITRRAQPNETL